MVTRDIAPSDLPELREIYLLKPQGFLFPELENPLYFSGKIASDNGVIIGAAFAKLTAEITLIMDQDRPLRQRMQALLQLSDHMKEDVRSKGLEDSHAFVRNPNVLKLLTKLGFQVSESGTPMVIFL